MSRFNEYNPIMVQDHRYSALYYPAESEGFIGLPNYWINTATLGLFIQDIFFASKGAGPVVHLTLVYPGTNASVTAFGRGWRFSYDSDITEENTTVVIHKGNGSAAIFQKGGQARVSNPNAPAELVPATPVFDRLLDYGTFFLYLDKNSRLQYRYDKVTGRKKHPLSSISDWDNNRISIIYNDKFMIKSLLDAAGREITFGYNSDNLCTSFSLPDGRHAEFRYSGQKDLASTVDLQGISTTYDYDAVHRVTRMVTGVEKRTTLFEYAEDQKGNRIKSVRNPQGNISLYGQNPSQKGWTSVTDPENRTWRYFNVDGRTEKIVDPLGHTAEFSYKAGLMISARNKNGFVTAMDYDRYGNLIRQTDAEGFTRTFTYDTNGNLISDADHAGRIWRYEYDQKNHLCRMISPAGTITSFTWSPRGQMSSMTDHLGRTRAFEYDRFGNITSITSPLGAVQQIGYDTTGLSTLYHIDESGNMTRFEYDGNERLVKIINPDGSFRTFGYGTSAGITITDENRNTVTMERNMLDSVTRFIDPSGSISKNDFDKADFLKRYTDPMGRTINYDYDPGGRLVRVTSPLGYPIVFGYDPVGNMISYTDERNNRTSFQYNKLNYLIGVTDPANRTSRFERDPSGRIVRTINPDGSEIRNAFDADGRIIEQAVTGKKPAHYGYDNAGNLTQVTDETGSTHYHYDAANRLISVVYPDNLTVRLGYDPKGILTELHYPFDVISRYVPDTRGNIAQLSWNNNRMNFSYDPAGYLIRETRSNGVETRYVYDSDIRPVTISHESAGRSLVTEQYSYDAAGNITRRSGSAFPGTSVESGMETPGSATFNNMNQLIGWNNGTCRYDANGNLIFLSSPQPCTMVYDSQNRLVKVSMSGKTAEYTYNTLGERIRVKEEGTERICHYLPDGRLLFETNAGGTVTWYYIYAGMRLIARGNLTGDVQFYHYDVSGNTRVLTDAAGEPCARYMYTPFGIVSRHQERTLQNRFTFSGASGVIDDGNGLYFMKNRHYHAPTTRFLQPDPLGIFGGTNVYEYGNGNPIKNIDPEGKEVLTAVLFLIGFLGSAAALGLAIKNDPPVWVRALRAPQVVKRVQEQNKKNPGKKQDPVRAVQRYVNRGSKTTQQRAMREFWDRGRQCVTIAASSNPVGLGIEGATVTPSMLADGADALHDASHGNYKDALKTGAGVLPGRAGEAGGAAGGAYDAGEAYLKGRRK
ncbi:MAG: hypothetical protein LUQ54_06865 [Methanoregula sp.]|nr:hypothetical protein [Methanoregula sp.]